MKKYLLLLITAMFFSTANAFAQGGTAGPLTWNINGNKLTISGEGAMPDYDGLTYTHAPWRDYLNDLTSIVIENGVTCIGKWAFNPTVCVSGTCSVSISSSVTHIGDFAFYGCCMLKSITIPIGVKSIGHQAFYGCFINSVGISNSVTHIGSGAFGSCPNLTFIKIPNSVESIGNGAFSQCHNLTSVTISGSVTHIGNNAFLFCSKLGLILNLNLVPLDIYYSNNPVFELVDQSACTLRVPTSSVSAYQSAPVWQDFNIVGDGFLINPKSNNLEYGYATGSALQEAGTMAIVNATAYSGYRFVNWTKNGKVVSNANLYCFEVTEDIELVANFVKEGAYLISASADDGGHGNVTGGGVYEENEPATVIASASGGYKFVNWTKNGIEIIENPYSFTVTEDVEFVAHFVKKGTYLVSVNVNNEEYGSVTGGGVYEENTTATLNATAHTGYRFVNWTKDGVELFTDNPYSFIVTEDIELVANFEEEVGIENFELSTLKIYPNPTTGMLRIENSGLKIESVAIYDVFGKIQKIENLKMENTIDISHLSAGVYFVKIRTEAGEIVRKVVKE